MAFTPQQLMDSSKCVTCIPPGRRDSVIIYLLCQLVAGGGGGGSGVTCALVDPTTAPTSGCGLYVNTLTGSLWYWDAANTTWIQLIGP